MTLYGTNTSMPDSTPCASLTEYALREAAYANVQGCATVQKSGTGRGLIVRVCRMPSSGGALLSHPAAFGRNWSKKRIQAALRTHCMRARRFQQLGTPGAAVHDATSPTIQLPVRRSGLNCRGFQRRRCLRDAACQCVTSRSVSGSPCADGVGERCLLAYVWNKCTIVKKIQCGRPLSGVSTQMKTCFQCITAWWFYECNCSNKRPASDVHASHSSSCHPIFSAIPAQLNVAVPGLERFSH
ncbi:hypothetical protein DAEQUDRAFT_538579 [Daedalea quercina L-15889]|uniref:Uncharacterized protein n=1 Tax=Daedalea quercina L-15889 TaxID=1314783 RepID=A0A165M5Z8_9APHY|nr:hypothetical protein DAEQUDRAFT_538579 [Daedalea quercina L-15889]